MNRIVQTIIGVVLLGLAGVMAIAAMTSKGAIVLAWPHAVVILAFATIGGFFCSKSLMTEAIKTVAGAVRRVKPVAP